MLRSAFNKFPYFFVQAFKIDFTHMIFSSPKKRSPPTVMHLFQQLLKGSMEVLLCERVNDLRHSLLHPLNCLITTASELRE